MLDQNLTSYLFFFFSFLEQSINLLLAGQNTASHLHIIPHQTYTHYQHTHPQSSLLPNDEPTTNLSLHHFSKTTNKRQNLEHYKLKTLPMYINIEKRTPIELYPRDNSHGGLSSSAVGAIVGCISTFVLLLIIGTFCYSHISKQRREHYRRHRHLQHQNSNSSSSRRKNKKQKDVNRSSFTWGWKVREAGPVRNSNWEGEAPGITQPSAVWDRIPGGPRNPTYRAVSEREGSREMESARKVRRMKRVFALPVQRSDQPQLRRKVGLTEDEYQSARSSWTSYNGSQA